MAVLSMEAVVQQSCSVQFLIDPSTARILCASIGALDAFQRRQEDLQQVS